jgi:hypothetical protein
MMKMKISFRALSIFLSVLTAGVLASSCNKLDDGDDGQAAVSGLMAFNLAVDQQAIITTLNGNSVSNAPLSYGNYTGTYVAVYSGNRNIRSFNATGGAELATKDVILDTNMYYSTFLLGVNNNYSQLVVHDDFEGMSSTTGKAYFRYIQAIPGTNPVNVVMNSGGSEVLNDQALFGNVTEFASVDPGELDITLSNGSNIDTSRSIDLEAKKVYTILLMGQPDATDEVKRPQIKFILNGTLPEDGGRPAAPEAGRGIQ